MLDTSCCTSASESENQIVNVPVRDDNYAYLVIDETSSRAAAVDPYDMLKVQKAANEQGVTIVANLTTHHHFDHRCEDRLFLLVPVTSHLFWNLAAETRWAWQAPSMFPSHCLLPGLCAYLGIHRGRSLDEHLGSSVQRCANLRGF